MKLLVHCLYNDIDIQNLSDNLMLVCMSRKTGIMEVFLDELQILVRTDNNSNIVRIQQYLTLY